MHTRIRDLVLIVLSFFMLSANIVFGKEEMPPPPGVGQLRIKEKGIIFTGIDEYSGDKIYILAEPSDNVIGFMDKCRQKLCNSNMESWGDGIYYICRCKGRGKKYLLILKGEPWEKINQEVH